MPRNVDAELFNEVLMEIKESAIEAIGDSDAGEEEMEQEQEDDEREEDGRPAQIMSGSISRKLIPEVLVVLTSSKPKLKPKLGAHTAETKASRLPNPQPANLHRIAPNPRTLNPRMNLGY